MHQVTCMYRDFVIKKDIVNKQTAVMVGMERPVTDSVSVRTGSSVTRKRACVVLKIAP